VAYAYRYFYDEPTYDWVFWVRADTELNLKTDLGNLTNALALPEQGAQNLDEKVQAVQRWLERNGNWLLIFDNADQPSLLKPFRPKNPHGRVLVTSRAQVFDDLGIAHPLEVSEMSVMEATDFLFCRTERQIQDTAEVAPAHQLAKELGYLPLALEQAGAFIYERKLRFADYLTSYRQRRLALLQRQLPKTGNYPESVATTWSLNFQAIEQTSPAAAELLRFSAFLSSDNIPQELLVRGAKHLGDPLSAALADASTDPLAVTDLLEPLTRYSLIRLELEINCYTIHRMVQEVLQDGMEIATRQQWVSRAVAALTAAFPQPKFSSWPDCDRLTPHVQTLLEDHHPCGSLELATLLNETGYYLHEQGQYSQAEPLWVRSLAIREQKLGAKHVDTSSSLNSLGLLYESQGRYTEAEPFGCDRLPSVNRS
jgi:Tetratricopeptide repeat